MKHAIIIRFLFKDNIESFDERLKMFKCNMIESLTKQTVQDFDLYVLCNESHNSTVQELWSKIRVINNERVLNQLTESINDGKCSMYILEHFSIRGFKDYDILTRVDSDDRVREDFVEHIHSEYYKYKDDCVVLSFTPIWLELSTNKKYVSGNVKYHNRFTSMFSSVINPSSFIYCDNHIDLWKQVDRVVTVDEGYCYLCVHNYNLSTKIKKEYIEVEE